MGKEVFTFGNIAYADLYLHFLVVATKVRQNVKAQLRQDIC